MHSWHQGIVWPGKSIGFFDDLLILGLACRKVIFLGLSFGIGRGFFFCKSIGLGLSFSISVSLFFSQSIRFSLSFGVGICFGFCLSFSFRFCISFGFSTRGLFS